MLSDEQGDACYLMSNPAGGHNSFDDVPWINRLVEFTQSVLSQDRVGLLSICFGRQIVGRALGMEVGRSDQGWEIAVCDVDLTAQGKELLGCDKLIRVERYRIYSDYSKLILHQSSQRIQQMHQDVISDCPPRVTLLGSSPRCAVQGMYLPGRFIGHHEFNWEIETEVIENRTKMGVFSEDQAQEALSRVHNEHDGVSVGATFFKFLLKD